MDEKGSKDAMGASKSLKSLERQKKELERAIRKATTTERAAALKQVRKLCKKFGFTAKQLEGYITG